MTLTGAGEAGRLRAREWNLRVHQQTHEGIDTADFVTTINVLRRMVASLGGYGDLPDCRRRRGEGGAPGPGPGRDRWGAPSPLPLRPPRHPFTPPALAQRVLFCDTPGTRQ